MLRRSVDEARTRRTGRALVVDHDGRCRAMRWWRGAVCGVALVDDGRAAQEVLLLAGKGVGHGGHGVIGIAHRVERGRHGLAHKGKVAHGSVELVKPWGFWIVVIREGGKVGPV